MSANDPTHPTPETPPVGPTLSTPGAPEKPVATEPAVQPSPTEPRELVPAAPAPIDAPQQTPVLDQAHGPDTQKSRGADDPLPSAVTDDDQRINPYVHVAPPARPAAIYPAQVEGEDPDDPALVTCPVCQAQFTPGRPPL